MTPSAIRFTNVDFARGASLILEQVSVDIHVGQMVAIVGPNGGGKTTFLRLCLGLLSPTRGTIRVFDQPPVVARSRVGYVPQHFIFDDHFPVTVMDVVMMGRLRGYRIFGFLRPADKDVARDALREVELLDLADRPFSDLSGGQRQRVLIARALATQPDLLLLDEPTANVDGQTQHELHDLMSRLAGRLTVVVVTHDMHFVGTGIEQALCINRTVAVHPTAAIPDNCGFGFYDTSLMMVRHDKTVHGRHE